MNTNTVYHIVIHSPEHSKAVQERLFQLGFRWEGYTKEARFTDSKSIQLNFFSPFGLSKGGDRRYPDVSCSERWQGAKVITMDDLYGPEFSKPSTVEVNLNASHKAIVSKNKIVVGCQEFPASIIAALVEAHKKVSQ